MKVVVDVRRVEQSWDCDTQESTNYLVIEFAGIECRIPCTEEAIAKTVQHRAQVVAPALAQVPVQQEPEGVLETYPQPMQAPHFREVEPTAPPAPPKVRALQPVTRPRRTDDDNILQG